MKTSDKLKDLQKRRELLLHALADNAKSIRELGAEPDEEYNNRWSYKEKIMFVVRELCGASLAEIREYILKMEPEKNTPDTIVQFKNSVAVFATSLKEEGKLKTKRSKLNSRWLIYYIK